MAALTGLDVLVSTINWLYWIVAALVTFWAWKKGGRWIGIGVLVLFVTPVVIRAYHLIEARSRHASAVALFQAHCKTAGEKIHKRIEGVDGIFLMKLRSGGINDADQFKLDDPYGRDYTGDGYILSFLRGFYMGLDGYDPDGKQAREAATLALQYPDQYPKGYAYVEAVDPKDGTLYRYTAARKVVRQMDGEEGKRVLKRNPMADLNIYSFALERTPIQTRTARYGVTYDDISTRQDREYWIAGSSLRVVDLQTNEVVAERIGYMMDRAQGSRAGGRSPWLLAVRNACPMSFGRVPEKPLEHSVGQGGKRPVS